MNDLQIVRQVQHLLRSARWSDSGLAFQRQAVVVTLGVREQVVPELLLPAALIRPGPCQADPDLDEQPGVERIGVVVTLVVANAQDQFGERMLIGSNRSGGSHGRGLLEAKELVKTTLLQLGPASGLPIVFRSASNPRGEFFEGVGYFGVVDMEFTALGTVARTYQAPEGFRRTNSGSTVALAWNAATRYDARRFILRRAAGSTAPATSGSGVGVTLGQTPDGSGVTSVTDSPGAGTYSYSLFAVYDDTDAGSDVATSDPQTLVGTVVT